MPTKITMPQLGESVSEGTVGRWLKSEGDTVKKDEPLVEIVTDKITEEMPSPFSGTLTRILVKENETVKVGADIAEMDAAVPATAAVAASRTPAPEVPPAPTIETAHGSAPIGNGSVRHELPGIATPEKVSPLARRLAQEHAIDLRKIKGSGEGGRVRKEDILAFLATQDQPGPAPVPAPAAAPLVSTGDQLITSTPARRAIAEHMVRSKHTSPHATTLVEVDMTMLARWLDQHKDEFRQREGVGLSYQTFVIKATVEALKEYPYLNSSWTDEGTIALHRQIHI